MIAEQASETRAARRLLHSKPCRTTSATRICGRRYRNVVATLTICDTSINDPVTKIEFPAAAVGIDEKEILGSYSAAADIQESAAELVLGKKLPVMEIVTHRFPLDRIQEALELAARPTAESLKILIAHA